MVSGPEGPSRLLEVESHGIARRPSRKAHKTFYTGFPQGLVGGKMAGPHQDHEPMHTVSGW